MALRQIDLAFVRRFRLFATLSIAASVMLAASCSISKEYLTGIEWPKPPIMKPGKTNAGPPSDAIVLFDGKDLSAWKNGDRWKIEDGAAIAAGGEIETKQEFGDCQLHIEWSSPVPARGESQGRGNSGVFFMGRYELQVLDSYDNETYYDGQASAIYKQTPPMVNAMRPPGEWNSYDVIWTSPRFKEDGSLESPAHITVLHNGVLTLNHFALLGTTPFDSAPVYEKHGKGPIKLQDHGNPVRFRNIWIREIKPIVGKQAREPFYRDGDREVPVSESTSSIQGEIKLDGKPVENARITFRSDDGTTVEDDVKEGKFEVENIEPGSYAVEVHSKNNQARAARIPEKYRKAGASGLSIEVVDGESFFDFNLRAE